MVGKNPIKNAAILLAALPSISLGATIGDFQDECMVSYKAFSEQVTCIKKNISDSPNSNHAQSDPDVRLYVLTADKLVDDVENNRITAATARVELQKAYIEIRERRNAALAQRSAESNQAERVSKEIEAQRLAAVRMCVNQSQTRRAALANANPRQALSQNFGAALGSAISGNRGVSDEARCMSDPNWYQTIPAPPTVTNCRPDYIGGVVCSSSP